MRRVLRWGIPNVLGITIYLVLSLALLVTYSSYGRPIWYDEMIYFVLGGFESTGEVLDVIYTTVPTMNQGVTGAYMLADYWSLTIFGAQSWALRLPSLVFGAYLLAVAAIFLRGRGVGWLGLWALPVLLVGQETLMYFAGEARTYMPLAAATVGTLAYYFVDVDRRSQWSVRLLGWSAVLMGVLFHPYFALYWPLIILFAVIVRNEWSTVIRFANPPLVIVGTIVFLGLASQTWLRGKARTEDLDPYFWLGDSVFVAVPAQLFQFLYMQRVLVIGALALVIVTAVLSLSRSNPSEGLHALWRAWWPPIFLTLIAMAAAFALAAISLSQGFWIIPRQWIASIALVSIAVIWFWSRALSSVRSTMGAKWARGLALGVGIVIAGAAVVPTIQHWKALIDWHLFNAGSSFETGLLREDLQGALKAVANGDRQDLSEQEWIEFTNANTAIGGPVWSEFAEYYRGRDWSTFVLRD